MQILLSLSPSPRVHSPFRRTWMFYMEILSGSACKTLCLPQEFVPLLQSPACILTSQLITITYIEYIYSHLSRSILFVSSSLTSFPRYIHSKHRCLCEVPIFEQINHRKEIRIHHTQSEFHE